MCSLGNTYIVNSQVFHLEMPINLCAWYCVSTPQFIWLNSLILWQKNCWMEMTSIEGNVTLEHPKPGPHSELYSCRCGCIKFQHLVLHCRALATHRDHLDRGSGRVHVICWQLMCEKEREMTAWPGCQLPLGSHYNFSHVQASSLGFSKRLHASGTVLEASWIAIWQRDCKGKVQRESRSEARAHSHVVLGSCLPQKT